VWCRAQRAKGRTAKPLTLDPGVGPCAVETRRGRGLKVRWKLDSENQNTSEQRQKKLKSRRNSRKSQQGTRSLRRDGKGLRIDTAS